MILTIITLTVAIVGTLLFYQAKSEITDTVGLLLFVCGGIIGIAMLCIIIIAHVGVDAQIEENRIEYNALCQRYEIITSEYEDVSKSDVIKDIAEWNKKVYSTKHWAYNPWTNWFYSKRVADDMKMIEMEGSET
jgi:hypothetical protein